MGRSIPSFRHLIEIERLNWSGFKKGLPTKNDREAFDAIFENAILYTSYLSHANRSVPLEPMMMGALFYNYKMLLKLCKEEDNIIEESIGQKLFGLEREKSFIKALFDKTCERWHGLLNSLHKKDREQLLKMLVDCCCGLDDEAAKTVIDSKSSMSVLFLFSLVLQNQKLINRFKMSTEIDSKNGIDLLDFID